MILALSQVSTLHSSFTDDVEDYAASGCAALDVWFTKLEQSLKARSTQDVLALLQDHGVSVPTASFQGGLLDSQGDQRRESWELFEQRLELCQQLQIGTLIVAADVARIASSQDYGRVQMSLRQAAERAGEYGVRIALEFQSKSGLGNNLQSALALVEQADHPALGVCLDFFHFETGPSKPADLGYLTNENLFVVQLSDLAGVPRELARDADRILPGDGELDFEPLRKRLEAISFSGVVTVELLNPQIWQVPARQFADVAMSALKRVVGD